MQEKRKIIGTFIPLSSLYGSDQSSQDFGTFASGMLFLDWLHNTKQNGWQFLPLHETHLEFASTQKHVPSPYKGYGVGLDHAYLPSSRSQSSLSFEKFTQENAYWLEDYALFCALRDHFGTDVWTTWEEPIRLYDQAACATWRNKLSAQITKQIQTQWLVHQWYDQLRSKAKSLGISLIGDMPFYLPLQSPLVWSNQSSFVFEKDGSMPIVSGAPNTSTAHFGRQVWGHPLYSWNKEASNLLGLWKLRIRYLSSLFNHIRFDHAKAFFRYGVMDMSSKKHDLWKKGPGEVFFTELIAFAREQGIDVFVEDSGDHVRELRAVSESLHVPGMSLFRFGYDEKFNVLNHRYAEVKAYPKKRVAYSTTHDTETLLVYLQLLTVTQKQKLAKGAHISYHADDKRFVQEIVRALISSPADMVIIPMQDWLLLTDRINVPGTEKAVGDTNWQFRLPFPIEELPLSFVT